MDPTNRGPEDFHDDEPRSGTAGGHAAEADGADRRRRPARDAAPAPEAAGQQPVRVAQLVSGDYLLTVNPLDGSEIEPCPPGALPARPERHGAERRAELRRAAAPTPPAREDGPRLPLLHRDEERERLGRLLSRGRSVRLTGPSGAGRTALLDAVADDCAALAPDGVVRLTGCHRSVADLLHDLYAAVHHAPDFRPERAELLAAVARIGAVVVLDDMEFGGAALDELLDATPECAWLLAATPDVAAPSTDSHVEEVFLGGLDRTACLELLEHAVDRPLTDEEADWAADLWFESEGLPLRFVQAGALLRLTGRDGAGSAGAALPSLAQAAAPAGLLAARLDEPARDALRFAVALGGELPHQAHLPALVGDTHADAAVGALLACGLITTAGPRYRLAAGVREQLLTEGYGDDAASVALTAAQHYAWWAGHPSVEPERICREAEAVLAVLGALAGGSGAGSGSGSGSGSASASGDAGQRAAAVLLARTAAPAFAAGLHWGAWERCLRYGQEAARLAGEVGEEAYFHHELGVLALCTGHLDRARAELEASIGLRGVLADKRGAVAGRRALALVADRSRSRVPAAPAAVPPPPRTPPVPASVAVPVSPPAGEEVPDARREESAAPPARVAAQVARVAQVPFVQKLMSGGNRRNLVAAGAGVVLAGVLAAVVTLGAASGGSDGGQQGTVRPGQSASQQDGDGGLSADEPAPGETGRPALPGQAGAPGRSTGPSASSSPGASESPGGSPSASQSPGGSPSPSPSSGQPSQSPTRTPTTPPPTKSAEPTTPPQPTKTAEPKPTLPQPTGGTTSNTASGPADPTGPGGQSGQGGTGTPVA
ncbi:ATPase AAA [Streptomyces mashuensis]|uniref:ATPase AAA n=1 Tax=Streptomyces mashuensis TaxID=33904 RepID=A0A919EDQ9_9ACTN|nr:ATP-binding protein [Streptomyces mashuensis]GHF50830.1 ATPase AAA [Streptomyces mashuensis]